MAQKDFRLRLTKGSVNDTGSFEGIASTYGGPPDLGGDIVKPGAFTQAIKSQGSGFPLLWQHKTDVPIGIAKIADSAQGLMVNGQLVMADPQAQVAHEHLKAGSIKGLSIGYQIPEGKYTYDDQGSRILSELKLYELSIVTLPMNENAMVTSVKGLADAQRVLRGAAADAKNNPQLLKELRAFHRELRKSLSDDSALEDVCQCDCPECLAGDCADCSDPECQDPNCDAYQAAQVAQAAQAEEKRATLALLKNFAAELRSR
jgi:HK97 family phage prohead protease